MKARIKTRKNKKNDLNKFSIKEQLDMIGTFLLKFNEVLIPAIIMLIPIIYGLYIINLHGYLSAFFAQSKIFNLNSYYKILMYVLGIIYLIITVTGKNKIKKSDIGMFIFMIATIVSTIFAIDRTIALNGYYYRYEGMYTLLFYSFLYLNAKTITNKDYIKSLLFLITGVCFLQFILSILQLTGVYQKFIFLFHTGTAIGLTENCNFLGSLMCMLGMLGTSAYFLFEKNRIYYLLVSLISYITLILANSTGPYISFIFVLFILIIVMIIRKKIKWKRLILIVGIFSFLYPAIQFNRTDDWITPDIRELYNFSTKLIKSKVQNVDDSEKIVVTDTDFNKVGTGRLRIWKKTIGYTMERPLIGFGPDNLAKIYIRDSNEPSIADKAHNIYLHIFVSSGIFALIGYLYWLIRTLILGLKEKENPLIMVLFFAVLSYAVQGFFNINVIEVTPYFYVVIGLMMGLIEEKIVFSKKIDNLQ